MARIARLFALAFVLVVVACGKDTPAGPPVVSSVIVTPGADTLLTLGRTRQFTAVARDASGNPISGVTLVWSSSNPSVATVDAASGLVTAVGNGLSIIRADAGGVLGQATLAVAQVVATVLVTPPSASFTTVGATQAFSAEARDSSNATVSGVRFLWGSSNPAVATVDTAGVATARGVGQTTISAAGRGVPGYAGVSVTQAANQLAFTVGPSAAVAGEAINPAMQVEVRDAAGTLVTGSRAAITIAFGTNPGSATLHGSTTVNAVGGIATFSGITVEQAAAGYTLVASTPATTPATSAAFTISSAAPKALRFYAFGGDTAGAPFPGEVRAVDRFGNLAPSAVGAVFLRLSTNPTGATLINGNFSAAMTNGVASLSIYSIQKAASGYQLVATGSGGVAGLDSAFSPTFFIDPATPAVLAYVQQPGVTFLGDNLLNTRVRAQDSFGNPTPGSQTITLALGGNPWAATVSGTLVRTGSGTVIFDSLKVNKVGLGYTIVASAPGLTSAVTSAFSVVISLGGSGYAAGGRHTCALVSSGAAACWGDNTWGQLGGAQVVSDSVATLVYGGHVFTQITAGDRHTCGLDAAGTAWCWGDNLTGQLGNPATSQTNVPLIVLGGHQFTALSAGGDHTCGLATGGIAYCWGADGAGQLGDSGKAGASTATPTPVYGAATYRAIAAGGSHTCAIAADSTPRCWGDDTYGQLGDSTLTVGGSDTAVVVRGNLKLRGIAVGTSHTCANGLSGTSCWGRNNHGQLGNNNLGVNSDKPVFVTGGVSLLGQVAAGGDHGCVIGSATTLYCWGSNASGEIGNGLNPADAAQASQVQIGGFVPQLATAGGAHTCAKVIGKMYCWGSNAQGQIGDGTRTNRPLFTAVREQ